MTARGQVFKTYKRPLFLFGYGVRSAQAAEEAVHLVHRTGVPAVCTWGAADFFRHDDPLYIGTFGTHGVRYANFAVQNADLIVSIGSRLDTKATGSPVSSFAPKADVVMVDIDKTEIAKFSKLGRYVDGVCQDAKEFINEFDATFSDCSEWKRTIRGWKERYPAVLPEWREWEKVHPYVFVDELTDELREDDLIVSDTGCPLGWFMQAFRFKGQRFFHAMNNTPMGYGLPAAIGAAIDGRRVIVATGDGGLMVNVGELATLERHNLNIKIILFNNLGHSMCRATQRQWLGGEYPATSYEGGLATPNFQGIAKAHGFEPYWAQRSDAAMNLVRRMLERDGPGFLELAVDRDIAVLPQARFGFPLEDQEPPLPREEIQTIMKEAA
jgi:acetolactate synthase-1/2/3 large subunit